MLILLIFPTSLIKYLQNKPQKTCKIVTRNKEK